MLGRQGVIGNNVFGGVIDLCIPLHTEVYGGVFCDFPGQ